METIPTIEKKETKEGGALRGKLLSVNRLIGAVVLSAAALGSPDAEAGRRGDIAGGVLGGIALGAIVTHEVMKSKEIGKIEVSVDQGAMETLEKTGISYNSSNKSLQYRNDIMWLETHRRNDKAVSITQNTPYQLLVIYTYEDSKGVHEEKWLTSTQNGRLVVQQRN